MNAAISAALVSVCAQYRLKQDLRACADGWHSLPDGWEIEFDVNHSALFPLEISLEVNAIDVVSCYRVAAIDKQNAIDAIRRVRHPYKLAANAHDMVVIIGSNL